MTFALFDEGGKFLAGRIMSKTDASAQVELESGRRIKVKSANIVLEFEKPAPAELIAQAQALSPEIDLDLAWEFAPADEFSFIDFAHDYYSEDATPVQQAAVLFCLFGAPHYFRRAGKGRFKKAPEDTVKAALLAIERKQQQQMQIDVWAKELMDGQCPQPIQEQLYKILFKPDKNALEYKAVVQASRQSQVSPLDLFKRSGAIVSAYEFHWRRFLYEFFPKGTQFADVSLKPDAKMLQSLPVADLKAFSIDDSATTEIDDALSVQGLGSGEVVVGIHIAAPGLGIAPADAIDHIARARLSTVYMPGWKITMLPDDVVQAFTLDEGKECPAVSLYVCYDEESFEVKNTYTRLERVPVVRNFRYDLLQDTINDATLSGEAPANYEFARELGFLYRLVKQLKAQREEVRGKPETFNRPDYTFRLLNDSGLVNEAQPTGEERVSITERQRGSALDLIVAEMMIVANSTWGGWLASTGVPGIYRSQHSMQPGVKVRMSTRALPHAGIGVSQYIWSTSPLRRYTDLVNQWQIIACAQHGATAALAAPFKPKDAELFSIISAFEAAYAGYNGFQRSIERYWTLRYLQQNDLYELEATVMKDGMVRANRLPLVFMAVGAQNQPRGTVVLVKVSGIDTLTLDMSAQVLQVLQAVEGQSGSVPDSEQLDDEGEDGEEASAGPISVAVDMSTDEQEANAGTLAASGVNG